MKNCEQVRIGTQKKAAEGGPGKAGNSMRHVNIPVFIPHLGCPHTCVFCNQHTITGKEQFGVSDAVCEIERALSRIDPKNTEAEIAFFGGSFTGIDRELMLSLLRCAKPYLDSGRVHALRVSTRPDYIDAERLRILGEYDVRTIELGIQSMDDRVLAASGRGHTAACSEAACRLIKAAGFRLIGQMMTGLPASTPESEEKTAEALCALGCDGARIYPTVVFAKTALDEMARKGAYTPLSLTDAVSRTARAYRVFLRHSVPVIRIGLCAQDNLSEPDGARYGTFHAAIGELTENEIYRGILEQTVCMLPQVSGSERYLLLVPQGHVSKVIGQRRSNLKDLEDRFGIRHIKVREDPVLPPHTIRLIPLGHPHDKRT